MSRHGTTASMRAGIQETHLDVVLPDQFARVERRAASPAQQPQCMPAATHEL